MIALLVSNIYIIDLWNMRHKRFKKMKMCIQIKEG